MVNSVYTAVLMAPESAKKASMDSWGNVKIPLFDSFDTGNTWSQDIKNGSWITMDQTKQANYSSLTGTIVVGISSDGISTFTIQSSYFQLKCGEIITVSSSEVNATTGPIRVGGKSSGFGFGSAAYWTNS
jgi:hypothetical protein